MLELRPRAVFTPEAAQADRQKILDAYAKRAASAPRSSRRSSGSTRTASTWCSRSTTATATLVSRIAFVGNQAFSENRLREIIDSREQAFYRFLSNATTTTRSG